jgi:hypothetical protein
MKKRKNNFIEFIKPTWKKLIIFLLISLIFIPFIEYDNRTRCIVEPCNSSTTGSVLMFLLFSNGLYVYLGGILYLNLLIGLIISYFLACSIYPKL